MPILKLWSSDHKVKKAISVSEVNMDQIFEKAKEKNIYGTRIFLIDGTEIEDNDVLKDFQNEVLVIANEEGDFSEKPSSVRSYSTSSELTIPNSPTSSIGSNISEFQIPYSKFPSVLFSKLSTGGTISLSDVNIIVRNVADELIYNEKLATRSNYRAIAQELCERFPQLYDRDPDTNQLIGTGYYTVFKKLEERVHYLQRPNKRASNSSCSDTTRKKSKIIKNLSSGCKEWQPSDPVIYEDDEITPETKKTWLMSNASLKERDESKVELYMNDTYGLQRTFLNSIPAVFTIANEWPVLLEEKYMIVHFDRLCGLNSILCVDTFLSKATALNEQIHALLPKKQTNALENHIYDTEKNDINLLQLIARYFKEDLSYIFVKFEEPLTRSDIASRVKTTAPNIIVSGINNISYLLVENSIISEFESTSTCKSALQLLFAAYYNLNMVYPEQCQNTLEFLQRAVIMEGFLHHMAPQFLHPALQSFGCGAFRPIGGAFHPLYPSKAFARQLGEQYALGQSVGQVLRQSVRDDSATPPLYRHGYAARDDASSPGSAASASPRPCKDEDSTAVATCTDSHDYFTSDGERKSSCGVCGARLGPGVAQAHFLQELQHLYSLSALPRDTSAHSAHALHHQDEDARWETYQRIRANRQRRLKLRTRKRHHTVESMLGFDEDDRRDERPTQRAPDEDEPVDVEGDSLGWPEPPMHDEKDQRPEPEVKVHLNYAEDLEISSTNDAMQSPERVRMETPKPLSLESKPSEVSERPAEVTTSEAWPASVSAVASVAATDPWPSLAAEAYIHAARHKPDGENLPSSTDSRN